MTYEHGISPSFQYISFVVDAEVGSLPIMGHCQLFLGALIMPLSHASFPQYLVCITLAILLVSIASLFSVLYLQADILHIGLL